MIKIQQDRANMSLDQKRLSCCEELINSLPQEEHIAYKNLLTYEELQYVDELHKGLTYLAISCMELAVLFSKFEKEERHEVIIQRMTIGYLFEVYNSIWKWIGKPIKNICEKKKVDANDYKVCKKKLDVQFAKYVPLLKEVRNGTFHTKSTGDKDWINSATRLLFRKKIPHILRRYLYEYGYNVNVITFQKKVHGCYPGIGGFSAIHPSGKIMPMKDLYYTGASIKITPDEVT